MDLATKRGSIVLLAAIFAFCATTQCLAARYELQIDSSAPTIGTMRLVFDGPLESNTELYSRQQGDIHAHAPICEDTSDALDRVGMTWVAQAGCSVITWEVGFEAVSQPKFDVSTQTNLYHRSGWWLFSEWGNLLRPGSNDGDLEICAKARSTETCRRVPTVNEPPLLMLIGEPDATTVLGETTFRFFSGHLPSSFGIAGLYESYERQLSYLHSVMAEKLGTSPPSPIDVLVLGIDGALGVTGGAAGSSSFLANLVVTDGRVNPSERARLLWLSGHELSHVLGLGTGTLWASESLAHYYGFKSLEQVDDEGIDDAAELFEEMVEDVEEMGLIEANQRVTQRGEGQYYGLFYSKGAAFWKEVDEVISAATGGERSLDHFLPLLLNGDFGADGKLPPEFLESVQRIVDPDAIEQVVQKYLSYSWASP